MIIENRCASLGSLVVTDGTVLSCGRKVKIVLQYKTFCKLVH